jgi:hypothetical protein
VNHLSFIELFLISLLIELFDFIDQSLGILDVVVFDSSVGWSAFQQAQTDFFLFSHLLLSARNLAGILD